VAPGFRADLARSVRLFRSFRVEQSDPDRFYGELAGDAAAHVASFAPLHGALLLDVGGGPGYFADAFEGAGACYVAVDADAGELRLHGRAPWPRTAQADGTALPFADSSFDVSYSSNVAEHVRRPWALADEMVRVTRPGGIVFLSYTLWYGPWGGHETAPWHFLGGARAADRYARRHGHRPKNDFGVSMFPVSGAAGVRWARQQRECEVLAIVPRYLPRWAGALVQVPGVREVLCWNLAVVLRKS
jgi:SAM-dependent methyltransferase